MADPCPCGKEKSFDACCGRFLSGRDLPRTAEQLMRSRFSAYALGGYGQYLLDTWFPATAAGLSEEVLSDRQLRWEKLEVLNKSQSGDQASVEFKAYYRPRASAVGAEGNLQVMHEHSEFRRVAGRWLYVGGQVDPEAD
ncbi:YchJ family protein [Gilvimarinus sp. F26214L]|uniref:YchJ family protein n=1 Tax=Gilvimarinus sp. DZF01 TaxID=3461371 RepID=UPI004045BE88